MGLTGKKKILLHANNKVTDHPAEQCSLISAFVAPSLISIIAKHVTCKISVVKLVSAAVQAILSLTWFHI